MEEKATCKEIPGDARVKRKSDRVAGKGVKDARGLVMSGSYQTFTPSQPLFPSSHSEKISEGKRDIRPIERDPLSSDSTAFKSLPLPERKGMKREAYLQ